MIKRDTARDIDVSGVAWMIHAYCRAFDVDAACVWSAYDYGMATNSVVVMPDLVFHTVRIGMGVLYATLTRDNAYKLLVTLAALPEGASPSAVENLLRTYV